MDAVKVGDGQADEDATDLAALLEENAALRAEHEQLLAETAEYGLTLELPVEPASAQSAKAVGTRYETLEQQRKALLGVQRLGDELQELSERTATLRAEAEKLREENSQLNQQNAALRAASRATTPALSTRAESKPAIVSPAALEGGKPALRAVCEGDIVSAVPLLPPVLDQRAQKISAAIKLGDQEALNNCSEDQRKELVAAMLKVGLFDAALPASLVPSSPPSEAGLELPPAAPASKAVREPASGAPRKAVEGGATKGPPAAAATRPVVPQPAPAPAVAPAPASVQAPAPAAAPAAKLGRPAGVAPQPAAAEPQRKALAPAAPAPAPAAPAPRAAAPAETKAAGLAGRLASPATGGSGALESQAQEISEMLKTCDDSERKELVADMLRQGLFGSGPPSTLASAPRGDAKDGRGGPLAVQAANGKEALLHPRAAADEVQGINQELAEHARERVVREKLQELNTKARA